MKYLEVADVALLSMPLTQLRVLAAWSDMSSQYLSVGDIGMLAVPADRKWGEPTGGVRGRP